MEADKTANGHLEGVKRRKFTWRELSKLNGRHNAHVAVRGKVYDVSSFVSRHPGGIDQIMFGAGRDITQLFESYHSLEVYKTLEKFYVGDLVDNELPVFPRPSDFYQTLKKRVDDYFKNAKIDPKIDYWMFLRYAVFLLLSTSCWLAGMRYHSSLLAVIAFGLGWGFFSAMVAMSCTHDASHFAVTHKPWVWKLVGSVHDFYHGASMYVWIHQELSDIRRIKWSQKWVPRYFYQHVYVPMLYCVLGVKTRLQDFHILLRLRKYSIRLNPPRLSQLLLFLGGKLTHITYRFIIPQFFMPWKTMLLMNLIAEISGSYWLALIFQTSHVVSEVEWPKPDKDNMMHMDWAEMQVATTQDYATDSWFWTVFTGALNHQTTHHLFPGVIQSHYMKITPIVKQTCEEFGLKYHYVDSTTEAIGCHFNHLKILGQESKKVD